MKSPPQILGMKTMNISDHFRAGSALLEFLADRLGAPNCWPNDCKVKTTVFRMRKAKHVTVSGPIASRPLMNKRVA